MSLFIDERCIGCAFCQNECPVTAISYDGDRYHIDPAVCVGCGTCSRVCLMDAVQDTQAPAAVPEPHDTLYKDCDLAVVGGGAAGLVAAARYAEQTGKRVVVLEKNRRCGGGGYFAVGLMVFNSEWERKAGIPCDVEARVAEAMARCGGALDPVLLRGLFTSVGAFFDWLCSWAPAEQCFSIQPNPMTGAPGVGNKDEKYGCGKFLTTHILPYLRKLGVEVLTQTEAKELVLTPERSVAGVVAEDGGGRIELRCRQCLLATGSLIRSRRIRELVPAFAGARPKRYAHNMPGLTGDALDMAERAGIGLDTDSITLAFVGAMPVAFEQGAFQMGERRDAIRVNLNGERFCNESEPGRTMAEHLMYQPAARSYTLLDASILESPEAKQAPDPEDSKPAMPEPPYPGGVPDFALTRRPVTPNTTRAYRALAETVGHKVILYGETLEDIAVQIGADPAQLKRTVERYNDLCRQGQDTDFGKAPELLRPLTKPPYVAILNYLYLDGVFGGLRVTPDMEVRDDGGVIPGLYAAGDIAGGRYVNDRLHKTEVINDYTWAVVGGFLAANRAIRLEQEQED